MPPLTLDKEKQAKKFPDRRLGSSWYGWDGDISGHEGRLHEGPGLFLFWLLILILLAGGVLALDGWLLSRFVFHYFPWGQIFITILVGAPLLMWCHAYLFCLLALWTRWPYLAFPWFARWLTLQVPFLAWMAKPFGVSRDRLGSSCVAVTNVLSRLRLQRRKNPRTLVLLPRCLTKDMIQQIRQLGERYQCPVAIAPNNRTAREKVREHRPQAIIAVACERDLVHGLYDYGHKLPILVLANQRPEGPCLNALVNLEEMEEMLQRIGPAGQPEKSEGAGQ